MYERGIYEWKRSSEIHSNRYTITKIAHQTKSVHFFKTFRLKKSRKVFRGAPYRHAKVNGSSDIGLRGTFTSKAPFILINDICNPDTWGASKCSHLLGITFLTSVFKIKISTKLSCFSKLRWDFTIITHNCNSSS